MAETTPDATPFPKPPSIKGLQVQMVDDALALGIHHAGVNLNVTALVDLEKKPANPKRMVCASASGETPRTPSPIPTARNRSGNFSATPVHPGGTPPPRLCCR